MVWHCSTAIAVMALRRYGIVTLLLQRWRYNVVALRRYSSRCCDATTL